MLFYNNTHWSNPPKIRKIGFGMDTDWSDETVLTDWSWSPGLTSGVVFKLPPRKNKKILLLHGWFSSGSSKEWHLHWEGYDVFRPELSNWFFNSAVKTAQDEFDKRKPDAIVGSSRGAAVAMSINSGDVPLILLAPAWKQFANTDKVKSNTIIIHSPNDDIIPVKDSVELATKNKIPLLRVGENHRLNCLQGKEALDTALDHMLKA